MRGGARVTVVSGKACEIVSPAHLREAKGEDCPRGDGRTEPPRAPRLNDIVPKEVGACQGLGCKRHWWVSGDRRLRVGRKRVGIIKARQEAIRAQ